MRRIRSILEHEAAPGVALLVATALALIAANSPLLDAYLGALNAKIPIPIGHGGKEKSVLLWINDGLMAGFFLFVALELKRHLMVGELASRARIALPAIAAVGGMVVPALIYAFINRTSEDAIRGWAIPAATDIAFALGILSLTARGAPASVRVFLAALAVLDDLGAIVIIALFYTSELHLAWLAAGAGAVVALAILNRLGVLRIWPYLVVGAFLWWFVLRSGVHATLAGVAIGLCMPLRDREGHAAHGPLATLEHALAKPVNFLILPIFALANAGLPLKGMEVVDLVAPVPLGIALGLFLGKTIGVTVAAWIAVRLGYATLPAKVTWPMMVGVALLCGIGFTMSLFIGGLAFREVPDPSEWENHVKLGVLSGSIVSAIVGALILRRSVRVLDAKPELAERA